MKSPGHHTQTLSCKYSANVFKSLKTPLTFISLVRLHVKSTRKQSVSLLLLITTVDNVILYSYKYLKDRALQIKKDLQQSHKYIQSHEKIFEEKTII